MPIREQNIVQAPEILRRLTTRLGIKQHSITPTLQPSIQPVVVLDDARDAQYNRAVRTYAQSVTQPLGDGLGHPFIFRWENISGSGIVSRLRYVEINALIDLAAVGSPSAPSYVSLGDRYTAGGTTYTAVLAAASRAQNLAEGNHLTTALPPGAISRRAKTAFILGSTAGGITNPSTYVWSGQPLPPGGPFPATGLVRWDWRQDFGEYGPVFGEGLGIDVVVSTNDMPAGWGSVSLIWQEEPSTTEH